MSLLDRLIALSLQQRLLVLLAVAAMAAFGARAYSQLPIDAYPDISPTQVKLVLKAPGMTPEEVESRVIAPLERELLGVPGATMLRSTGKYALADITLDFRDGTEIYWARQQVAERYAGVAGELPAGVDGGLAPIATPLSDVLMFSVEGGGLSLAERRTLLDWTIRPALRTIPGVADVNTLGGHVTAFVVEPDRARLLANGLHLQDLADALERNNRNDGAGRLHAGENSLVVRVEGALANADDIGNVVLKAGMPPVRVRDVASVRTDAVTRNGAVTRDGRGETVQGIVVSLRGVDASALVHAAAARLQDVQATLPPGVRIETFYNRSSLIERAVSTVRSALVEASVLVVILLLLFLGDVRAAVVVSLMLPLAALATFLLMRLTGQSANLMSLGGLAIAIGLLVDAAVVVVENIVSRLQPGAPGEQLPRLHRVFEATREVAMPVAAGMLIIVLTFLPLLTLQGLEGKLFGPVALTIVFALGASLLLSLTFVPALASLLLPQRAHRTPWLMRQVDRLYPPLLERALVRPTAVLAAAGVALLLGVAAYAAVGKSFLPTMDEGDVMVQIAKPAAISLEHSLQIDLAIERALAAQVPEVSHIVARVGTDELGLDPMGLNETDMFVQLRPKSQWRRADHAWMVDQLRAALADFPGLDIGFTQPIEMRVAEMLTGSRGDVAVKIFGADIAVLDRLALEVAAALSPLPGAQDVVTLSGEGMDYLRVQIDAAAAGRSGLSVADIQDELRAQVDGVPAGLVLDGQRRVPVLVRGAGAAQLSEQRFRMLQIAAPGGGAVPLSAVARLVADRGPVKVGREQGSRYSLVQSNVDGRDLVGFVDEARAAVAAAVRLPAGYRIEWGGEFENQQRAARRLMLMVPVALAGIFLVLFLALGSARQALLILANIPFALVGGIIALWLSGQYLSVPAAIGFIALLGIAVLNGLVLVACFNQLRASGLTLAQVARRGARQRVRPVLMTASITALGLVPLLLASGPGSEIQRPLAIVVIGGLVTSTALTLLLLPLAYLRWSGDRDVAVDVAGARP